MAIDGSDEPVLWHVSEDAGLAAFRPRPEVGQGAVVWGIADERLAHYLVPRDCPRVCFRARPDTAHGDRARFLGPSGKPVLALAGSWWAQLRDAALHLYELPRAPFRVADANAGYFVSEQAVRPLRHVAMQHAVPEILRRGYELRLEGDLRALASAVSHSTLSFSLIRMRNLG